MDHYVGLYAQLEDGSPCRIVSVFQYRESMIAYVLVEDADCYYNKQVALEDLCFDKDQFVKANMNVNKFISGLN